MKSSIYMIYMIKLIIITGFDDVYAKLTPWYPFHWYLSLKAADGVTLATRYICNCRAWQVLYVGRMHCFLYFFFFFFFKFLSSEAELTIKFWNFHTYLFLFQVCWCVWNRAGWVSNSIDPAGTWRLYNVCSTSMQHRSWGDIVLTSCACWEPILDSKCSASIRAEFTLIAHL